MPISSLDTTLDHIFRHEYGRVVSHLVHRFGIGYMDLVEDAVQESLMRAMEVWTPDGLPDAPAAWIVRVAQNHLLDQLKRHQNFAQRNTETTEEEEAEEAKAPEGLEAELNDGMLRMMFSCCHPSLKPEYQMLISLKVLCGFTHRQVGLALVTKEEIVAKGYTRAKERLRGLENPLTLPEEHLMEERLQGVLQMIYRVFNEGYTSTDGDDLLRLDLCAEAIRLTEILLDEPQFDVPTVHGLMALMLFQVARFGTRQDDEGRLITLQEQDRSEWDEELIDQAQLHLDIAWQHHPPSDFTLQAAIEGVYTAAPDYESTHWELLLKLCNEQVRRNPDPVLRLNRVIVLLQAEGPAGALHELDRLAEEPDVVLNPLLYAIRADAFRALDIPHEERANLVTALQLTENETERSFLKERISYL